MSTHRPTGPTERLHQSFADVAGLGGDGPPRSADHRRRPRGDADGRAADARRRVDLGRDADGSGEQAAFVLRPAAAGRDHPVLPLGQRQLHGPVRPLRDRPPINRRTPKRAARRSRTSARPTGAPVWRGTAGSSPASPPAPAAAGSTAGRWDSSTVPPDRHRHRRAGRGERADERGRRRDRRLAAGGARGRADLPPGDHRRGQGHPRQRRRPAHEHLHDDGRRDRDERQHGRVRPREDGRGGRETGPA